MKHLVYLDAFLPGDGQSLQDLVGRSVPKPESFPGPRWLDEPVQREYDDPADAAFAGPRRVPHPSACFNEPVRLASPLEGRPISLTYIKATGEPRPAEGTGGPFWVAADRTKDNPRWRYYEIATNHMVSFNRPQELVEILVDVSR